MGKKLRELSDAEMYGFSMRISEECIARIRRHTVCILGDVNGVLVQNGSGVLLEIADKKFLLSAAHVMDFITIHGFRYFIGPNNHGRIPTPLRVKGMALSPYPEGRDPKDPDMRDDDHQDVAICELTDDTVESIVPTCQFLRLFELDRTPNPRLAAYMAVGYPYAMTDTNHDTRMVDANGMAFFTELHYGERDDRDKDGEILLRYPEDTRRVDKSKKPMPHPKGMSGCGIWRIADAILDIDDWTPERIKLVGIQHQWRERHRYLVGSSVAWSISLVEHRCPELRRVLAMQYV